MSVPMPLTASLDGRLRPLCGLEEELVAADRHGNAAALGNELLARCLTAPGRDASSARREIGGLLVPERDLALVDLRRRTLGRTLELVLTCPSCSAPHDVELDLDRLTAPPPAPPEVTVAHEGRQARVRLPTAADQARVVAAAAGDVAAGRDELLALTLVELDGQPGPFTRADAAALEPGLRAAIDAAIEDTLPDVDLALTAPCPSCGGAIDEPVNLGALVLAELRDRSAHLLHEVHVLAREYHWSERQILRLPVPKRRAYLAMIEAERDAALIAGAGA